MKSAQATQEKQEIEQGSRPEKKQQKTEARVEGASWQFYFVVAVIAVGILAIMAKAFGLF